MKRLLKPAVLTVLLFSLLLTGSVTAFCLLPKQEFSRSEKRQLQSWPALSAQSLADGTYFKNLDAYFSDHFPARRQLVGLNAYGKLLSGQKSVGGITKGKHGYLIPDPFAPDSSKLRRNAQYLKNFCANTGVDALVLPVPSIGYVMDEELPAAHRQYPDDAVYDGLQSALGGSARIVDVRDAFCKTGRQRQLYYRTDHHWTSAGAYLAYRQLMLELGRPPAQEEDYTKERIPGFTGTSYAKSGLWLQKGDTIELWQQPGLRMTAEITDDDTGKTSRVKSPYFREFLMGSDAYSVFLGGNHSLIKLTNPEAPEGKLLLIKDSFANSLAPFLMQNYREVYLVDLRYYKRMDLGAMVKREKIQQVVFLYSTEDYAADGNFTFLK